MFALKLTQIGNSVGVILPKEALAKLKLQKGETVHVTVTPDGIALTPLDPGVGLPVPLPVPEYVTVAVNVTDWPAVDGLTLVASAVLVPHATEKVPDWATPEVAPVAV